MAANTPNQSEADKPLDTTKLTWAALLGRWLTFARSAVLLPDNEAGRRMRNSVPDLITLQAVWFALHHLDELAEDERALGLDRAEILINKHGQALAQRWRGMQMPPQLGECIDEARQQLLTAQAL